MMKAELRCDGCDAVAFVVGFSEAHEVDTKHGPRQHHGWSGHHYAVAHDEVPLDGKLPTLCRGRWYA